MSVDCKKYQDELKLALRLYEVSGQRVGEVLAEVETHVADTGEDPVEAFGPPRRYAAQVAADIEPGKEKRSTFENVAGAALCGVLAFFGSGMLLDGLEPEGPNVVYTPSDVVRSVVTITLVVIGVSCWLRAARGSAHNRTYGVLAAVSLVGIVPALLLVGGLVQNSKPLLRLAPWHAIAAGTVVLLLAAALLMREFKFGRVVDPR